MNDFEQGKHLCLECNYNYHCEVVPCDECEEQHRIKDCPECSAKLWAREINIDNRRGK